jgi:alpha-tubulin suppressor-like RCC1 family protein
MLRKFYISFCCLFFLSLVVKESSAANYYWIGGTGNWSDLTHWATASGGTTNPTTLPGSGDNVNFDANSFTSAGQSVTLPSGATSVKTMNWSAATFSPTFIGGASDSLYVYGSLVFASSMTNSFAGDVLFLSPFTTDSVKTNNIPLLGDAVFFSTGTWNLKSALTVNGTLYFLRGTLKTNSFAVTCAIFDAVSTYTRTLQPSSTVFTINGSGTAWSVGTTGFSITSASNWKIIFNYSGTSNVIYNSGGSTITYNVVQFLNTNAEIYREGSLDSLLLTAGMTLVAPSLKTQSLSMIVANGTCSSPITIKASSTSVATFNRSAAGTINTDYLRLTNINKSGSGTFNATNSIIESGTSNWTITGPASVTSYFWIGGSGNWSDPTHWSTTSGGSAGTCVPGPTDNVTFDANSFSSLNDFVNIDQNAYCNDMLWTNAGFTPVLTGNTYNLTINGSLTLNNLSMTATFTGNYIFNSTATETITTNGVTLNGDVYLNGSAGQWNLGSAFTSNSGIYLQQGHFHTQNFAVTANFFSSSYTTTRILTLGTSIVSITGDGDSWEAGATAFTLNIGTSQIQFNNSGYNTCNFIGAGLTYYDLIFNNSVTSITGSNTCRIMKVAGGKTLILEGGITQTVDSLIWIGTCDAPITIESSSVFGTAANISKTGYSIVNVTNVYLRNITASTLLPLRVYNATSSTGSFTTTGWVITNAASGGKKYWIGGTGNWSDVAHWSATSGGVAGTCIPTAADTVIFDANSFSAGNQVVTADLDAYCKVMDWTGSNFSPEFSLVRNVIISHKATLVSTLNVERTNRTASLQFITTGNNVEFDSKKASLITDILFYGTLLTDSLKLLDHMYLSDTNSFLMILGTFITNNDSINAGSMVFLNTYTKNVNLGSSYIDLTYGWNSFTAGTLVLNAGTSTININGHSSFDYFYGDGRSYSTVILSSPSDTNTFMSGSNTFTNLQLNAGIELKLTAGTTQTITNNFVAVGTCNDSIRIESTTSGVVAILSKTSGTVTTECLTLKDITRSGAATFNTLFSTNLGNVTGFNFISTAPVVAGFSSTYDICLGTASTFTNSSVSYSGGTTGLSFSWSLGDGNTSVLSDPVHTYSTGGTKYITLTAIYSNGCVDTHSDSVRVNAAFVNISTSELDNAICTGDAVTFTLNGETGSLFCLFIDGVAQGAFTSTTAYTLSTLTNGQVVSAQATLNSCPATSTTSYTMTVSPLPTVVLSSSDADNTICTGTSVTFTASGSQKYQFSLNGSAVTTLSTVNTFTTASLVNGDVVSVTGIDTTTNCDNVSASLTFTVNTYPIPSISNNTGTTVCAGTAVTFTGSGASLYEYYVNGVSQGAATAGTFTTTTLTNGAVISLTGTTNGCTATSTNSYTFTINPIPSTTLTNNSTANTICSGQSVVFTGSGASSYQFFINGVSQGAASGVNTFTTSALTNGQTVTVTGTQNSCSATSSGNTMTVNPLPTVTLSSSDADNSICLNQSVTFTATGGNTYEFLVNGVVQGAVSASSVYTTTSITNGQTVSVRGYTAAGCSSLGSSTFTFTVLPLPNANFYCSDADLALCEGTSVTYTATGGTSYEFFVNGISQVSSASNTYATTTLPSGSPVVSVSVTGSNGCSVTAATTFTMNVTALPVLTLSSSDADNAICSGDNVTFTAGGAASYQFFINGVSQGALSSNNIFSVSTLTNGQTVSVNGTTNGCSSTGTTSYTFSVVSIPNVNLASSDIDNIICQGQSVTFTASGATVYEFFVGGVSQGAASATTTFSSSSFATGNSVSVVGTNGGCSANGNSVYTLTVNPSPVLNLSSNDPDLMICQGTSVAFTASGSNLYEFFIDGVSQGTAGLVNTYTTSTLANGNVVTVSGTSAYGCNGTGVDTLIFNVISLPVVTLVSSDADNQICTGESVTFTAGGATDYEFFVDGISQGAASATNTFSTGSLTNLQEVSVAGTANNCSADGNDFTFTVFTYPNVSLVSSHNVAQICSGDSITFIASGSNIYEFFIDGISQGAASSSDTFITTGLTTGQVVSVEGVNNVCASAAAQTFSYQVNSYPTPTLVSSDADNTICFGESVTFTSSGATTYEFLINGISQNTPSASVTFSTSDLENSDIVEVTGYNGTCASNSSTTFLFTVQTMSLTLSSAEENLICDGSSISFTASGADLYEFFVNGVSQGSASSVNTFSSASINNGDIVSFNGTNLSTSCVQASDDAFIQVMSNPVVSADGPTTFCEGDSVILSSTTSAQGYQWLLNGAAIAGAESSSYVATTSGSYSLQFIQGGNGTVWSSGANQNGQLGDSSLVSSDSPVVISLLQSFEMIESGSEFSIAVDNSGNVWVWGYNGFGMLGDGTFTDRFYPYQNPAVSNASAVAAGEKHSVVLLSSGSVQTFGDNTFGQLGNGTTGVSNFPVTVSSLSGVTAISAGKNHTIALKSDGTVWAWGNNSSGQLGDGTFVSSSVPVQVSGLSNITSISAGGNHNLAIRSDSTIWAWGNNSDGQLGNGTIAFTNVPLMVNSTESYIAVAAGAVHSLAVDRKGRVVSFGNNLDGQLGDGTTNSHSSADVLSGISQAEKVFAGDYHSFAITTDGSVYAWGRNTNGQLGDGSTSQVLSPVRIAEWSGAGSIGAGSDHTSVVMDHGAFCESSAVTVSVTSAPAVSIYDNITFLSTDAGVSYQWYYNNNPILGGLGQSQNLIGQGTYFVQVTYANGCTVTSPVFSYIVGVDELNGALYNVYPNPSSSGISVQYNGNAAVEELVLSDISGREVRRINVSSGNEFILFIEREDLEDGMYFLNFISDKKMHAVKVVFE